MKNTENDPTKKRLTLTDIFFLVAVALLLTAIVAQDLAVYFSNKNDRSETFLIDIVISVSADKAEELKKNSWKNTKVLYEEGELGVLEGGFVEAGSGDGYVKLSNTVRAVGTHDANAYRIYGFNRTFEVGDKAYVIFEYTDDASAPNGFGYTVEITAVENITELAPVSDQTA